MKPIQDTFGDDLIKINNSNYIIADEKTLLDNNSNNLENNSQKNEKKNMNLIEDNF